MGQRSGWTAMTTTPEQTESAENARFEPVQGGVVIWDSISHMTNETAEQTALTKAEINAVHSTIEMELHPCASQERAREIADYVRKVVEKEVMAPAWEPLTPEVFERLEKEDDASGMEPPYYWLADSKHGRVRWGSFAYRLDGHHYFNDGDSYFDGITHIMPFITPEMPKA